MAGGYLDRTNLTALNSNLTPSVVSSSQKMKDTINDVADQMDANWGDLSGKYSGLIETDKYAQTGEINVKSFGAKGDGTTDDTTAIQNAINSAVSLGKKEVLFPAGTYLYTTLTNTSGLTFIGDGVTLNGTTSISLVSIATLKADLAQRGYNVCLPPYNADPTGVADSTEAFRQAMRSYTNYASITSRRIIYVPPGTYKITGTLYLRKGDVLVGAGGTASTLITSVDGIAIIKMGKGLISGVEVDDSGGLVPEVRGLWLQSSGASNGIEVSANGWRVNGCWFTCQYGIKASGTDGEITNCISDTGSHFLRIDGDGAEYSSTHSIIVSNCGVYAPFFGAIQIEGASDILINGCYFDYAKFNSIYSSGDLANHRIQINNCKFTTSEDPAFYDAAQTHISIIGGGWNDSIISQCIFSRSRQADIINSTGDTNGIKIVGCKFIDSNGTSVSLSSGDNIKIDSCEWMDTGSYPIDALAKIEVSRCTFRNPHSGGIPANDYDKGCIRLQQAAVADSVISHNVTDSSSVPVLSLRSGATNVYSNGNKSKWDVDVYMFTTNQHTSLNERSSQPGADHIIVKGMANQRTFMGTTAPTTGTFNATDRMVNTAPAVGQPKAWTCTVGGTPGTWVSEGDL